LSQTVIDYVYDPLNRVKEANYSNGDYYHYTYDAVGNRLSQISFIAGATATTTYVCDDANRLLNVNGALFINSPSNKCHCEAVKPTLIYGSAKILYNHAPPILWVY